MFNVINYLLLLLYFSPVITGQNFWKISQVNKGKEKENQAKIVWCTINPEEQQKCENFAMANERDQIRVGYETVKIECYRASNKDECMQLLDQEKATMTTLDAGAIFVGGRYHSLVPIAQEVLDGGFKYYYAVAVVKKGSLNDVASLHQLRDKKACFAGVETFAGWMLPINTLMKEGGMDIIDCNNHVKSATTFFGPSCAVNCLSDKFNPIGDNSDKLCQICIGEIPGGRCTDADPYAGYEGAFRCLLDVGDIAFLKHSTVPEVIASLEYASLSVNNFELLCKDGSRRSINEYLACNWGKVPSDAVMVSSAVSFEQRIKYQRFLQKFGEKYVKANTTYLSKQNNTLGPYGQADYDQYGHTQQEYDQFGNKVTKPRFKRQNFGNFGAQDDNPYNRNQNPSDRSNNYNQNDRNNQNDNIYRDRGNDQNDNIYRNRDNNRNNDQNDNIYRNRENNRNNDQNDNIYRDRVNDRIVDQNDNIYRDRNDDRSNQNDNINRDRNNDQNDNVYRDRNNERNNQNDNIYRDPFARDPYKINKDQFGINIDPYGTDVKLFPNNDNNYNNQDFNSNERVNATNSTYYEVFSLFESTPRYGIHGNLMFQDAARSLAPVPENLQTYSNFLAESLDIIMGIRDCPVNKMTLCVTSDAEKNKCVKMRTALKAQLLKPEMECYKGHSQIHCMQAIRAGTADVAVLDASDVYTAGLSFDLVPFISEVYNLEEPEYYVVAVAKESDPSTELTYLKNKNTCHGGINTAAGWVYPLAFLISNGWIRPYGCNSVRAAAEYFSKSCIPGALSTEYNTGVPYDNMCDLCHGPSFRYCRRDASEDYYGHTGAFRCLVEGGGHVAFVKHTTVTENTGGKKREWWTRDNLNDDYELLCPDGTRAEINEYEKCNLGKVKSNAIVTRGGYGYNETHINAYINLFMYAQTFYGRKTSDEFSFSMFYSTPPYSDLIFQDATTQLKIVQPEKREYSSYLGANFMRARRIVDCGAGAASISASVVTLVISTMVVLFLVRE